MASRGRPKTLTTDTDRVCTVCGQRKLLTEFSGRNSYCKPCASAKSREHYAKVGRKKYLDNKKEINAKITINSRISKYGVDNDTFLALISKVDHTCPGCKLHESEFNLKWHLDHCHETGKVRGVLCPNCNLALGHVKDSVETLGRLVDYLKFAS